MKTRIFLVGPALLAVSMGLFASGQREPVEREPFGPSLSKEELTVSGKVYFENRMHPELKTADQEYELLVPRYLAYQIDLEDGEEIEVSGYRALDMPCYGEEEEDEVHLWVTRATIRGEEYDLEDEQYGGRGMMSRGNYGPRGGMMGRGFMGGRGMSGWGRNPRDDWGRAPQGNWMGRGRAPAPRT